MQTHLQAGYRVGSLAFYELHTTWSIDAGVEPVWDAVADFERWPSWWTSVQRVEPLGPEGFLITWRGALPYELSFTMRVTRSERPHLIEGGTDGELGGVGTCRIAGSGSGTVVGYEWRVSTTREWMNLLAPVARPVFVRNHDHVMAAGGHGLARLLDTRVRVSR